MKKIWILGLLFLFFACPQEEDQIQSKDAVDLVPLDNEIVGWTRDGQMDIAENETQLYGLINGEGQVFIDNGFVKFVRQRFRGDILGTTRQLELRIVDMGDTANAKDVYDEIGTGSETPWTDSDHAGVEARIDETLLFDYKIDFWDNHFYVSVTIYEEKSQAGLNIAKLFANNVSEAISTTEE